MMFLHEPWSAYERRLARERRHQSAIRAIDFILYNLAMLLIGGILGIIVASL